MNAPDFFQFNFDDDDVEDAAKLQARDLRESQETRTFIALLSSSNRRRRRRRRLVNVDRERCTCREETSRNRRAINNDGELFLDGRTGEIANGTPSERVRERRKAAGAKSATDRLGLAWLGLGGTSLVGVTFGGLVNCPVGWLVACSLVRSLTRSFASEPPQSLLTLGFSTLADHDLAKQRAK